MLRRRRPVAKVAAVGAVAHTAGKAGANAAAADAAQAAPTEQPPAEQAAPAVDAPPVSYAFNLEAAGDLEIDPERVRGVLAAVAPIVGTARIASATSKIVRALELELEVAELEAETEDKA
jgi:hypothetical protein